MTITVKNYEKINVLKFNQNECIIYLLKICCYICGYYRQPLTYPAQLPTPPGHDLGVMVLIFCVSDS